MVQKENTVLIVLSVLFGVVSIFIFLYEGVDVPSMGLVKGITDLIIEGISTMGYMGIMLLTALEVVIFPIPSEIILPFSGYLAYLGRFSLYGVVIAGTIGSLLGSLAVYYLGLIGGRRLIIKYGKYFMITEKNIKMAEEWFEKYGEISVLISRLMPMVRTLISFPAGIGKMNLKKFVLYTAIGSSLWCYLLAYLGYLLGSNWTLINVFFKKLDIIVLIALIILTIYFILKIKERKTTDGKT